MTTLFKVEATYKEKAGLILTPLFSFVYLARAGALTFLPFTCPLQVLSILFSIYPLDFGY
jgi:hypothetical protein